MTDATDVLKALAARARARELCKLLGLAATEEHLYALIDVDPPGAPPADRPWPGARVVRFFKLHRTDRQFVGTFPCAAVRRRPKSAGYGFEAVSGQEEFGSRGHQVSQGYKWDRLLGVFPDVPAAEAALAVEFGDSLRKGEYRP